MKTREDKDHLKVDQEIEERSKKAAIEQEIEQKSKKTAIVTAVAIETAEAEETAKSLLVEEETTQTLNP